MENCLTQSSVEAFPYTKLHSPNDYKILKLCCFPISRKKYFFNLYEIKFLHIYLDDHTFLMVE